MKILTVGNHTLHIYSTAKEMPIARYNEFQKYLLIESGIGSDMASLDDHFARQVNFIANDLKPEAIKEAENTRHAILSILSGVNYNSMAFAVMVAQIDSLPCNDITEDGIEATVKLIEATGITMEDAGVAIEELKKKS